MYTGNGEGLALALTQGDPSGIGPDITLAAWTRRTRATTPFAVFGAPAHYRQRAGRHGLIVPIIEVKASEAACHFPQALPVCPTGHRVQGQAGHPTPADAPATLAAIEQAVIAVRQGTAAAVVTNPIAKSVLYGSGFAHPGHTEWLGELALKHWGCATKPVMMLWSEALAVVPVTIHIPVATVPARLTRDLIVSTAQTVDLALRTGFGVAAPPDGTRQPRAASSGR